MNKILISDFDNTLYTTESDLINNINKIKQFILNGNTFIIATGRSYIDISKYTEKYKIPFKYLICNDGGTIFDNNNKLIYKKDIPYNTVIKINNYIKENNLSSLTYFDTGFDYQNYPSKTTVSIIIRDIDSEKSKIILNTILNNNNDIIGYISDNWITILEKSVTKSNGIKILSEINNYNTNNIYTIGDTINDITMVKEYTGACMIKSTNDLKKVCQKIFNSIADYIDYIEKN